MAVLTCCSPSPPCLVFVVSQVCPAPTTSDHTAANDQSAPAGGSDGLQAPSRQPNGPPQVSLMNGDAREPVQMSTAWLATVRSPPRLAAGVDAASFTSTAPELVAASRKLYHTLGRVRGLSCALIQHVGALWEQVRVMLRRGSAQSRSLLAILAAVTFRMISDVGVPHADRTRLLDAAVAVLNEFASSISPNTSALDVHQELKALGLVNPIRGSERAAGQDKTAAHVAESTTYFWNSITALAK